MQDIDIPTSLLARLRESPASLPVDERDLLVNAALAGTRPTASILIPQKEVAMLLGIDRTTVWRLTNDGILIPIEIMPGMMRYSRVEIETLARHGWKHLVAARRKVA